MKRSAELRDLSEEHHYGLVAARTLRLAAEAGAPLVPAVEAFLAEWKQGIQPHFRVEEEILLPYLADALGSDHPLIVRTLTEHVALRLVVRQLTEAAEGELPSLVATAAQLLHDHIRFEERVLFPEIEVRLTGAPRQRLGVALKRAAEGHESLGRRCGTLSNLSTK